MTTTQPRIESDLIVRSAPMEFGSVDEKTRSIECVMCTENPVRMIDWSREEYFDEVLVAEGARMPSQLPLLDNHNRSYSGAVIGSVRGIRKDGEKWIGRAYFVEGDPDVEKIWQRVRQGHLNDVSIGYSYEQGNFTDIRKGEKAAVGNRMFSASDTRRKRVVTEWSAKELSTTPIGADQLAKMRSLADSKFGHSVNVNEISNQSQTRESELSNNDRQEPKMSATAPVSTTETKTESTVEQTRSEQLAAVVSTLKPMKDEATIRSEAIKEERERSDYARSFAKQGVRSELIEQAINDNWDKARMNESFLKSLTSERTSPVPTHAPAGHVADNEIRKEDIQALFLMRAGLSIDNSDSRLSSKYHVGTYCRYAGHEQDMSWAIRALQTLQSGRGNISETAERALSFVNQHRNVTMVDICQMALDLEKVRYDKYNDREIVTRAVTTQSVAAFLTNALGAQILDGFAGAADTTGWCKQVELPNDNPQPVSKGGMISRLQKRFSGQVPIPATREATEEFISLATYSQQYFVDRKDLLADRFGKIGDAPGDIGIAAMEVIQDLVYSHLLSNPVMADGNAMCSAAHGNNAFNAPLGPETLATRKVAMANQTNNGRLIGAQPGCLLVAESRSHYADELLGSSEKRDTTASTVYGTKNWAKGKYDLVSEPRLDVGCINPDTNVFVAGRPQDYYLLEAMKRWSLMKSFLRSNAGGPIVEQWMPGDGRIGVGTTVELEAGIKAVAWEGIQRGSGAAS